MIPSLGLSSSRSPVGTKVKLPDGKVVVARELSGWPGLLFRHNSQSGSVEVLPTDSSRWGGLNTTLHTND